MHIRPLGDRIVVRRTEAKERSAGGIIIPDNAKEKPVEGTVVAVGAGKVGDDGTARAPDVRVGDTVLFGKYAGSEVTVDGWDLVVLREDDVIGVVAGV